MSRLEDHRKGLQQLDDAHLIALKDEYETAVRQRQSITDLGDKLRDAKMNIRDRSKVLALKVEPEVFEGVSPLSGIAKKVGGIVEKLTTQVNQFVDAYEDHLDQLISEWEAEFALLRKTFDEFAKKYERKVDELTPEQRNLLESHRKVLEDTRALPELKLLQDTEKAELENLLTKLIESCNGVADALDGQTELRTKRVKSNERAIV